jgi:hypothetical protein
MGSIGDCFDKGFVSHCTSWCWLGGNPSAEVASLAFDESGLARDGRVEEPGVAVVGLVTGEQAGSVPGLDGGWMNAEGLGDLGDGELAGTSLQTELLDRCHWESRRKLAAAIFEYIEALSQPTPAPLRPRSGRDFA